MTFGTHLQDREVPEEVCVFLSLALASPCTVHLGFWCPVLGSLCFVWFCLSLAQGAREESLCLPGSRLLGTKMEIGQAKLNI